jgi:hypothetical protein
LNQSGATAKADFEAAQHEFSAEASTEAARVNVRVAQKKLGYTEPMPSSTASLPPRKPKSVGVSLGRK